MTKGANLKSSHWFRVENNVIIEKADICHKLMI